MGTEWRASTIGQLCDDGIVQLQTGPFGTQLHAHDYVERGISVVPTEAIRNRRIDHSVLPKISFVKADELVRHSLEIGDILFARRGVQATGHIGCVREAEKGFICGTGAIRLRVTSKAHDVCPDYLSHVLANPHAIAWFKFHAIGATMPNLNEGIIRSFPLQLPEFSEQRAIAHVLGTLDDKIELNRRRNQTLEAMARALFKDWFADFGPVRAKMEGREPYLPPDLWQLFPDRLDADGKPEGWRHSTIGSEVSVCGGSTPSTKNPAFWEGGEHHWATPKDLSALKFPVLLDTDRKVTDAGIEKISSGLLPVGTVLLSSRAPIGYLAITEVPTAINQGFIAMKCNGTLPNVFVLFWCRENMDVILGNANGSTFQEISKSNFRPIPVMLPPGPILSEFQEGTEPLYRHIVENERESKTLAQLRDTLLPKLISGELRIRDAKRFMEERTQ